MHRRKEFVGICVKFAWKVKRKKKKTVSSKDWHLIWTTCCWQVLFVFFFPLLLLSVRVVTRNTEVTGWSVWRNLQGKISNSWLHGLCCGQISWEVQTEGGAVIPGLPPLPPCPPPPPPPHPDPLVSLLNWRSVYSRVYFIYICTHSLTWWSIGFSFLIFEQDCAFNINKCPFSIAMLCSHKYCCSYIL